MIAKSTSRAGIRDRELRLDAGLIAELIRLRYGRDGNLLDAWAGIFDDAPDRTTVHNWKTAGRLPKSMTRFLRLARMLDCDPFLLLQDHIDASFNHAVVAAAALDLPAFGTLRPQEIYALFGPRDAWPNTPGLHEITGQSWEVRDFTHNGKGPVHYQTVEIKPEVETRPLAFHFAYRTPASPVWNPYGTVSLDSEMILLNNFNDSSDDGLRAKKSPQARDFDASTYFGPSSCRFRVASIHSFRLRSVERDEPVIRFKA